MLQRLLPHLVLLVYAFLGTSVTLLVARTSVLFDSGRHLPWFTVAGALLGLSAGLGLRLNGQRRPHGVNVGLGLGVSAYYALVFGVDLATGLRDSSAGWVSFFGPSSPLGEAAPPLLAALHCALISLLVSAFFGTRYEKPSSGTEPSMLVATALGCGVTLVLGPLMQPALWYWTGSLALLFLTLLFCFASIQAMRRVRAAGESGSAGNEAPPRWAPAELTRHAAGPTLVGLVLGAVGLLLYRATTIAPPLTAHAFGVCLLAGGAGALLTPFLRRMRHGWMPAILLLAVAGAIFAATAGAISDELARLPLPGEPIEVSAGIAQSFRGVFLATPWPLFAIAALLIGSALQGFSPLRTRKCTSRVTLSALAIGGAVGIAAMALSLPRLGSLGLNDDGKSALSVHEPAGWVEVRPRASAYPLVTIDRHDDLGPADADEAWARRVEAHLPLLLHPAPRRLLILGEITGEATRAALRHRDLAVEVNWISPALAAYFGPALHAEADRLGRPRPITCGTGPRMLLERSPSTFDVIVDLVGHGRVDLPVCDYTDAYVRAARRALRPDGIHATWLGLDRSTPGLIASLANAATRQREFPTDPVTAWFAALDPVRPAIGLLRFATMSGKAPFDRSAIAARLAGLGLDRSLDALSLLARYRGDAGRAIPLPEAGTAVTPTDRAPYRPERERVRCLTRAACAWVASAWEGASPAPWKDLVADATDVRLAMQSARCIRDVTLMRLRARAGDGISRDALVAAREAALRCLEATPDLAFVRAFVRRTAAALTARNRFDEADALWKLAVDRAPEWGEAHLGRADVVYRSHANFTRPEDWKPLKELAERAIALDETLARAWIYSGIADLHGTGDFRSARGCFDNAAKIDPDDPLLKAFQWRFLDADGRFEEAAALLLDALAAFPDNMRIRDAVFKMVPKLRLTGKPKTALYVLQKIEPSYREQAGYFLVLAEILDDLGDLDGAVRAARKCAAATDPPIQGYYVYLYRLLLKAGMDREAGETRGYIVDQFGYDPGVTDPDASGR